jgi:two-component system, OmpR family, sensor histidine kinase ArlS
MTIKFRISLFISLLFTILFGIISFVIIVSFSNFRKDEFQERLEEKALTSIKLLIDVKEVDKHLLKTIDQNSINQLYDEKTLIFDKDYNLIYSSLDDTKITWTNADLDFLKEHKSFFKLDGENEIFGVFYDSKDEDFYALISANDNYGKRKLSFLIYLIGASYLVFTILTWILTFYLVKRELFPLYFFHKKISEINEHSLETRVKVEPGSKNEINLIGKEFNYMMGRIEAAYQKQKEFTAHASHELRTPLARISVQLQNQMNLVSEKELEFLRPLFEDLNQLNKLISSLLLLSKIDRKRINKDETARVDEVIYNSLDFVHQNFPSIRIHFEIEDSENMEELFEVTANSNLLEIAFQNLIKNAHIYSDKEPVTITLLVVSGKLQARIENDGQTLTKEEQRKLFQPFVRGENAKEIMGLGLGLSIVKRIFGVYGFSISYSSQPNKNIFLVEF